MLKRGQVSVFVIIGIAAFAAFILIFMLFRGFQEEARSFTDPQEYLNSQLNDVTRIIIGCIGDESESSLRDLTKSGGHFNPINSVSYYGNKTSVLCAKVKDNEPCYNVMFTESDIDKELRPRLETRIKSCINLNPFMDKDYELTTGEFILNPEFTEDVLLVNLDYPITLTKGNFTSVRSDFKKETNTNFWKAAKLASDIVGEEALGHELDVPSLSSSNLYFEIARTDVNGGVIYMLVPRYGDYPIFYFGVER